MNLYQKSLTQNKNLFYEAQFNILSEAEYFSAFCANKLFHIVDYINTNNNQNNGDMLCSFLQDASLVSNMFVQINQNEN